MKTKKLIKLVSLIDKDASKYIKRNVDYKRCTIDNAFTWIDTEQGFSYWNDIDKKLSELLKFIGKINTKKSNK